MLAFSTIVEPTKESVEELDVAGENGSSGDIVPPDPEDSLDSLGDGVLVCIAISWVTIAGLGGAWVETCSKRLVTFSNRVTSSSKCSSFSAVSPAAANTHDQISTIGNKILRCEM